MDTINAKLGKVIGEVKEKPIYTYSWNDIHQKSFSLEQEINALTLAQPHLKKAGLDAKGFLETYYGGSHPKSLDTHFFHKNGYIGFIIRSGLENNAVGEINFFGQGSWSYTITASKNNGEDELRGKITYQFKGKADRWSVEDMVDDTPYLFSFYGEGPSLFNLPETFSKNYEPMLPFRGTSARSNGNGAFIEWKWITSYYDGPIAGYCRYNKKLHAYQQTDEKDFSRERLYAVYKLNIIEKCCIYFEYGFIGTISKIIGYNKWWSIRHKYLNKIFKLKPVWWKKTEPIGYFTG